MKLCSSDARREEQPGHSLERGYVKIDQKNAMDAQWETNRATIQ